MIFLYIINKLIFDLMNSRYFVIRLFVMIIFYLSVLSIFHSINLKYSERRFLFLNENSGIYNLSIK